MRIAKWYLITQIGTAYNTYTDESWMDETPPNPMGGGMYEKTTQNQAVPPTKTGR